MRKVLVFTALLILGLIISQLLGGAREHLAHPIRLLTMLALAFIMIHVGYEFDLDKSKPRRYAWDYFIAFTAATLPWIFVTLYFVFVLLPPDVWAKHATWYETLLAGRFAAPTSAGVLFAMLAAAGLGATWVFQKARILAIFDDLDTVLLMVPLQMMMIGLAWQLGVIFLIVAVLIWAAWRWLHALPIPDTWPWVLGYSVAIIALIEVLDSSSRLIDPRVPIHIEVLLPAFVLGCLMRREPGETPETDTVEGPEGRSEELADSIVSAAFMLLVGLNMPSIFTAASSVSTTITAAQPMMGWGMIALHVLALTVLSNLGKMAPAFCYRAEASFKERLAVAVAMWPRGEVGAGVLVISLGYGIGGPVITIALLSLALNLALTGVFIMFVRHLLVESPAPAANKVEEPA